MNREYVKFTMYDFIEDIVNEARKDINRLSPWLAGDKIFEVNQESPCLSEVDADYFHRITELLLFACKRA